MTDIRTRLHEVERLDPPDDLWGRATEHDPEQPLRFEDPVASGWRRVAAIAAAFAVFGAAAFFGWRIWSQDTTSVDEPSPAPVPAPDPWAGLSAGFHEFSPPPVARVGPATAWTGSQLVVWGGSLRDGADQFADGYVFDPASDTWTPTAPSPLGPRSFASAVWTGEEVVIWGGWDGGRETFADGATYDPATDTWRAMSPAPLDARTPRGAVWTGSEVIVWGSQGGAGNPTNRRDTTGAAYDPETDTWRQIPDAPFPINWGSVPWTGDEMIVVGASVHELNRSDTRSAVAMAYDPEADTWRELPPTNLSPNGTFAVWTGDELFALDYGHEARAYEPSTDRWRDLPSPPTDNGEAWPLFDAAGGEILAWTFGGPAAFDIERERWSEVDVPIASPASVSPTSHQSPLAMPSVLLQRAQDSEPPGDQLVYVPRGTKPTPPPSAMVTVPDVIGQNFLSALGSVEPPFRLLESEYRDAVGYENGTILEQDPAPGTEVLASETDDRSAVVVSVSPWERIRNSLDLDLHGWRGLAGRQRSRGDAGVRGRPSPRLQRMQRVLRPVQDRGGQAAHRRQLRRREP